jgi:hypothetical protein
VVLAAARVGPAERVAKEALVAAKGDQGVKVAQEARVVVPEVKGDQEDQAEREVLEVPVGLEAEAKLNQALALFPSMTLNCPKINNLHASTKRKSRNSKMASILCQDYPKV